MKKSFLALSFTLLGLSPLTLHAQVGIGTVTPSPNAVLELKAPNNNQGFLVPRLTTSERTAGTFTSALGALEKGLLVFDTTVDRFYYWGGTSWVVIEDTSGSGTVTNISTGAGLTGGPISVSGTIALTNTGVTANTYGSATQVPRLDIDAQGRITGVTLIPITGTPPGGTAGGDLTGTYPNPTVAANAISSAEITDGSITSTDILDGTIATADLANASVGTPKIADGAVTDIKVANIAPSKITAGGAATGEVLKWNGTNWTPQGDNGGSDSQTLSFTSPNLSIAGGNSVNISSINTDAQTLSFTSPNLSISGGNSINVSAINTDNQDLTLSGNTLSLTNDATTINLAPYLDNTDAQALTFTSPNLSISGGNSVNLSTINTDAQTLTYTPASGLLAISGGNNVTITGAIPGGAAGGDLTGTYPNPTIGANAISSTEITDGSVTTADILDGTIATADLANASVTAGKLTTTGVTANTYGSATTVPQITIDAQGRITAATLTTIAGVTPAGAAGGDLTGTYPNPTIAANAISSTEITDGSVTTADILDGTIATADLANASVTAGKLATTGVTANTYGSATTVPQITIDAQGRITAATGTTITGVAPGGTAGGDLTGSYPNPTVDGLQGRPVTNSTPSLNQVLKWTGSAWAPATDATGGGGVGGGGSIDQVAFWTNGSDIGGKNSLFFDSKNDRLGVNTANPLGTLHVAGSQFVNHVQVVDTYSVGSADYSIWIPNTAKPLAISLPPIDPGNIGRVLIIRTFNSSPVTLVGDSGPKDEIDFFGGTYPMHIDGNQYRSLILIATQLPGQDRWLIVGGTK